MLTPLIVILLFLWAGMILGISFLESWVKFRTPTLTKPVGLDVGRTVFSYFHKVQTGFVLLIILLSLFAHLSFKNDVMLVVLLFILGIQSFILLPQLNKRVSIVIAGNKPPSSSAHAFYGLAEIAKFVLLCFSGITLM